MQLEGIRDPRVVPFLLTVFKDRDENEQVRIYVLKHLLNGGGPLLAGDRQPVANAFAHLLDDRSTVDLRLESALALGEFTQIVGVLSRLAAICLAEDESIDLRYAAFTLLERAGPTAECIALLRQIASDETLGSAVHSVLSAWHVQ